MEIGRGALAGLALKSAFQAHPIGGPWAGPLTAGARAASHHFLLFSQSCLATTDAQSRHQVSPMGAFGWRGMVLSMLGENVMNLGVSRQASCLLPPFHLL